MDNTPPPHNPPNANISQQDLQRIVQAVMTEMLNNQAFAGVRNEPNVPQPAPMPQPEHDNRWRIEEFGLFEPDLAVDERHPAGDVITVGRDTIYRNVDAFVERIKDAVATKGCFVVRDNLHLCLRGAATRWYTFEVSDLNKLAMRTDVTPSLDQWIGHLTARFRPRMAQAVRENTELLFRVSDIRAGKSILTYFQSKLLRSRAAGFATTHSQLIQVYMGLEATLRLGVFEPTQMTTIDQYRELLMEKEEVWIDIYCSNNRNSGRPMYQNQIQRQTYQPRPLLATSPTWPARAITNQATNRETPQNTQNTRQQNVPQNSAAGRNQQTGQITSAPDARLPCPFHAARGQTYYHSPLACRLPEARNLLAGNASRIQQINFQSQEVEPEEDIPQYVDYDPDGQPESDNQYSGQYDSSRDFYAPYGSDIMHNLIDHPSVVNPLPLDVKPDVETTDETATFFSQECNACSAKFPSKNKLFKHLHAAQHFQTPPLEQAEVFHAQNIIKSTSEPVNGAGLSFRNYNFTEIQVNFDVEKPPVWVCLDSGCGMSCIDRKVLNDHVPAAKVLTLPNAIQIRGLGTQVHHANQYVVLPIYIPGTKDGQRVFGEITKEFHIVDNLSCNLLIGTDIIVPEGVQMDIGNRVAVIRACKGMQSALRVTPRGQPVHQRSVSTAKDTVVKPHSTKRIPIKVKGTLPSDRDLRFEAHYTPSTAYLTLHGLFPEAVVDSKTDSVVYYNTSDTAIRIRKNERIGTITEWQQNTAVTTESPEVVNAMFAFSRIIPSFSTAVKFGLTALQCAQLCRTPGTTFRPSPDTMLEVPAFQPNQNTAEAYTLLPTNIGTPSFYPDPNSDPNSAELYSLLPPLDPIQGSETKFGADAVNINRSDNITPGQVEALRKVLHKFPKL